MAMNSKVGYFKTTTSAATTEIPVTGVGFLPEVLICWWQRTTATTDSEGSASPCAGVGFATSSSDRFCNSVFTEDNVATTDCNRDQRYDEVVKLDTPFGSIEGTLDFVSFDADGFTLIVDNSFISDYTIHYIALGGDITGAITGGFDTSATGSQAISGLGFQPELVIITGIGYTSVGLANTTPASFCLGAATAAAEEFVVLVTAEDGSTGSNSSSYGYGDECGATASAGTAIDSRIEFTSMDADGFTVNVLENNGLAYNYLALAGGQFKVGDFVTKTDGTDIVVSEVGFQPTALMFVSPCKTESTQDTLDDNWELSIGAATGAAERACQASSDTDAANPTEGYVGVEFDEVYINPDLAEGHEGLMDLKSIESDGFICVMDDVDPSASFVGYIAFGSDPAAADPVDTLEIVVDFV